MERNAEATYREPRGTLFSAWQEAFTAPGAWSESFEAGIEAVVQLLEEDPRVAETCVLASLPVSTSGPLVWHREIVRARIAEIMHVKWQECGGADVPRMTFEVLLGEACTLMRARHEAGDSFSDLPSLILGMWGGGTARGMAAAA